MPDTTTTDTRAPLARARDAMGLREIDAQLAAVSARLRSARAAPRPELDDATEHALARVQAGEPVPDDLSNRVLTQRRKNEAAQVEAQVLAAVENHLKARLWELHRHADPGLEVLRVELDEILTQARPVLDELGTADSAEAAIAADRVDAWRRATTLAERYAELRAAQTVIVSGAVTPTDNRVSSVASREARTLVADFGTVRDPGRHFGEVGTAAASRPDSQRGETKRIGGRVFTTTITETSTHPRPWQTGDPLADLRWVVRDDARAWVPTIRELRDAHDQHQARLRDEARAAAEPPRRAERAPSRPGVSVFPDPRSR